MTHQHIAHDGISDTLTIGYECSFDVDGQAMNLALLIDYHYTPVFEPYHLYVPVNDCLEFLQREVCAVLRLYELLTTIYI